MEPQLVIRLIHYVSAALLVRMATAGSVLAVILMSKDMGATGAQLGGLSACLTLPHLFGPLYGKWLEKCVSPTRLIATMALALVLFFQLAIGSFQSENILACAVTLLASGLCISFLMGGLSTQLNSVINHQHTLRRKAQSWDTITYAVGATAGPLFLAIFASHYGILAASTWLMLIPVFAAPIIFTLPITPSSNSKAVSGVKGGPSLSAIVKIVLGSENLKHTIITTSGTAFAIAALPVIAIYLSDDWLNSKEFGAYLVTGYGLGNLVGAAILVVRPLKQEAILLVKRFGIGLLISMVFIALSHSYYAALIGYVILGVVNAFFFAATLAARTDYAPEQGASQVYMWVATAKIGCASLGTIAAGYLVDIQIKLPVILSVFVIAFVLVWSFGKLPNNPGG